MSSSFQCFAGFINGRPSMSWVYFCSWSKIMIRPFHSKLCRRIREIPQCIADGEPAFKTINAWPSSYAYAVLFSDFMFIPVASICLRSG